MSVRQLLDLLVRAARYAHAHGIASVLDRAVRDLLRLAHVHERHVWYELATTGGLSSGDWPADVTVRKATTADLDLLTQLDTVNELEARKRLAAGGQWWLVTRGPEALFSCWLLFRDVPVIAAPTGRISLPPGVVVLEDSVTAPAARGTGIAPRAWTHIADAAAAAGIKRMVTKVAVDNGPSRRAVLKAGFTEFALVTYRRYAGWSRTTVVPVLTTAGWLHEVLTPGSGSGT